MEPCGATTVGRRRHPRGPDTGARPERECSRRAIRAADQERMSWSNNSVGGAALPTRRHGVCRALSSRTESPRTRQSADRGDTRGRRGWLRASALTPGKIAELLRACGVIKESAAIWNRTGTIRGHLKSGESGFRKTPAGSFRTWRLTSFQRVFEGDEGRRRLAYAGMS
jgi:hypothetical protein